jgi:hypothetical protein
MKYVLSIILSVWVNMSHATPIKGIVIQFPNKQYIVIYLSSKFISGETAGTYFCGELKLSFRI